MASASGGQFRLVNSGVLQYTCSIKRNRAKVLEHSARSNHKQRRLLMATDDSTPETPLKKCTKCQQEFPATAKYFHRKSTLTGELRTQCKGCIPRKASRKALRDRDPRVIDLIGQRFNKLVVVGFEGTRNRKAYWKCLCDCGIHTEVHSTNLKLGQVKSCGCLRKERSVEVHTRVRVGDAYGRLIVVAKYRDPKNQRSTICECLCSCGNTSTATSSHLRSGHTQSCGCIGRELLIKRNIIHGLSKDIEYRASRKKLRKTLDAGWTLEMKRVLSDFQPCCVVCGKQSRLTVDHVLPLDQGYGLIPGNAVILCKSCNCRKNNKSLDRLPEEVRRKIINAAAAFKDHWETRCKEAGS